MITAKNTWLKSVNPVIREAQMARQAVDHGQQADRDQPAEPHDRHPPRQRSRHPRLAKGPTACTRCSPSTC